MAHGKVPRTRHAELLSLFLLTDYWVGLTEALVHMQSSEIITLDQSSIKIISLTLINAIERVIFTLSNTFQVHQKSLHLRRMVEWSYSPYMVDSCFTSFSLIAQNILHYCINRANQAGHHLLGSSSVRFCFCLIAISWMKLQKWNGVMGVQIYERR